MKFDSKQTAMLITLGSFLFFTAGCVTGRLPLLAKKEEPSSMDSYIAQAASEIQYDTDADVAQDYQPSAETASSYTAPPARSALRSSEGGGGSCCH